MVPNIAENGERATLDQMVASGLLFQSDRYASRSFQFRLPPDAEQGPETWYTIHLDAEVVFSADSGAGSVLVSALTNGKGAAQVEFYSARNDHGEALTAWDSADAFSGERRGREKGPRAQVGYDNLLQYTGVKPGLNTLTFEVQSFGAADPAAVQIGAGSGVHATAAGPVELDVGGGFPGEPLAVGEAGDLVVRVSNASPRIARDVEVTIQPRTDDLFVDGPPAREIAELDGTETLHFKVGRTKPGKLEVQAKAVAPNGEIASGVIGAEVEEGDSLPSWLRAAGIVLLGGAVGAVLVLRRRYRREAGK